MRLRASLHCAHKPRNFVDSSTGRGVFPILTVGGLWILTRGAVKCMTLHLWAANLKPFLVAHPCMEFTACFKCLWCPGSDHENRLTGRQQIVFCKCPWQCRRAVHWSSVFLLLFFVGGCCFLSKSITGLILKSHWLSLSLRIWFTCKVWFFTWLVTCNTLNTPQTTKKSNIVSSHHGSKVMPVLETHLLCWQPFCVYAN